jgi:hypothetical protein
MFPIEPLLAIFLKYFLDDQNPEKSQLAIILPLDLTLKYFATDPSAINGISYFDLDKKIDKNIFTQSSLSDVLQKL